MAPIPTVKVAATPVEYTAVFGSQPPLRKAPHRAWLILFGTFPPNAGHRKLSGWLDTGVPRLIQGRAGTGLATGRGIARSVPSPGTQTPAAQWQ